MNLIHLEYFNKYGKFVSEGDYSTKLNLDYEIRDEIIMINESGDLPGIPGEFEGTIYVESLYGESKDMAPMIIRV